MIGHTYAAPGLRARRMLRRLSTDELAAAAGVSSSMIRALETSDRRASPKVAGRICGALGLTLERALKTGVFKTRELPDREDDAAVSVARDRTDA